MTTEENLKTIILNNRSLRNLMINIILPALGTIVQHPFLSIKNHKQNANKTPYPHVGYREVIRTMSFRCFYRGIFPAFGTNFFLATIPNTVNDHLYSNVLKNHDNLFNRWVTFSLATIFATANDARTLQKNQELKKPFLEIWQRCGPKVLARNSTVIAGFFLGKELSDYYGYEGWQESLFISPFIFTSGVLSTAVDRTILQAATGLKNKSFIELIRENLQEGYEGYNKVNNISRPTPRTRAFAAIKAVEFTMSGAFMRGVQVLPYMWATHAATHLKEKYNREEDYNHRNRVINSRTKKQSTEKSREVI